MINEAYKIFIRIIKDYGVGMAWKTLEELLYVRVKELLVINDLKK